MAQQFKNNARALLTAGITGTATSIVIESAKADLFPLANVGTNPIPSANSWFKVTLQDSSGNVEIVAVRTRTAGSGILANVLRAQEGTTARAFTTGTVVGLRVTAADVQTALDLVSQNNTFTGTNTFTGSNTFSGTFAGNLTGNASTVTNGVYTSGDQTIAGVKTFSSTIVGNITNASAVTNGVYTTGDQTIAGNKTFSSPIIFPDATIQTTGVTTVRAVLFSASGTYNKPANVRAIFIQAVGASGGRASHPQLYGQGGTGGAGYSEKYITSPAASYAIVIGAGGTTSGTSGGTTTVSTISITGSGGSVNGQTAGGAGGVATGGDFNANGGTGGAGAGVNYGGGGGGGGGASRAGNGYNGGAVPGSNYTGGGGGGGTASAGSNGAVYTGGAGGNAATAYSASIIQPILAFDPVSLRYDFSTGVAGNNGFTDGYQSWGGMGGSGANGVAPVYGSIGTPSRLIAYGGRGGQGGAWTLQAANAGPSGAVLIWEFI